MCKGYSQRRDKFQKIIEVIDFIFIKVSQYKFIQHIYMIDASFSRLRILDVGFVKVWESRSRVVV